MDAFYILPDGALKWVDYVATWIGFSTVVGLLAAFIVFRKHALNSVITILLGYVGTIIGWSIARIYFPIGDRLPETIGWKQELLSPATFLIGLLGTMFLLFIYKLIAKQLSKNNAAS